MLELLAGERGARETARAVQACNDWLRLGPGRSLPALAERYARSPRWSPTSRLGTLKKWSQRHRWAARADAYDAAVEARKNRYALAVMNSGLALAYERVLALKRLADYLGEEIAHERLADGAEPGDEAGQAGAGEPWRDRVWLRDVKQVGGGDAAQLVELRRFNTPLLEQYRGVLDDLARETGGRSASVRVSAEGAGLAGLLAELRAALPPTEGEGEGAASSGD